MEERTRLTKDRYNSNLKKISLEDMIMNNCNHDVVGHLIFWHMTRQQNATDLIAQLYVEFDAVTEWDEEMTPDDVRDILFENMSLPLNTPDGLLANFYYLIDANAKLRERLKEYEDKEFGEESYWAK